MNKIFVLLFVSLFSLPAEAIQVVATLPWLGDIAHRLAPEATVTTLARGSEDPHFLSPTPALMAKVGAADLYIENGLSLELWSERLLDSAGNPKIRPGAVGYVRASDHVQRLEVPTELTRAKGDLHPEGNPHIWLDPLNAPIAADNIAAGLARVDPAHAADYKRRSAEFHKQVDEHVFGADLVAFMGGDTLEKLARAGKLREYLASKNLSARLGGWMGKAKPGVKVVFFHQSWVYFIQRFQMEEVGYVEDRPGVAPSASHKDRLAADMKAKGCQLIAVNSYYNDKLARTLGGEVGARVEIVPGDVGGVSGTEDYFKFMDALVAQLLK